MTTKKMTQVDAQAEAERRWGEMAFAKPTRHGNSWPETGLMKSVGIYFHHPHYRRPIKTFFGAGSTWEDAFKMAESNGH